VDLPSPGAGSLDEVQAYSDEVLRVPLRTMLKACAGGFSAGVLSLASAAGEHGLRADSPDAPSAHARLIAVPCAYDRLLSPPAPAHGLPPDQALRMLLSRAPGRFDPHVVKLFASIVGLYPVGTSVRLTTGEIAVVLEASRDPAYASRPTVKVIRTAEGPTDYVLDLAEAGVAARIEACVEVGEEADSTSSLLLA